ncbi:alpha/beta fold hydrolase [Puniceibacterium sp. IMCC21224]|uniref:alpha/beta fold hydrolase n=1 Tax=Puniceibacterium sp. IMCC21224 TaxID=1618204 RepID=UPI00064DAD56|nr:alpha/beta hydrolase [Puniceibacterium sp. IMCC21224]KMK66173.1 putative hydrolase or acyltransferase of alpha/beta superfamily [Puniceibacterium sp. IMCC21224]
MTDDTILLIPGLLCDRVVWEPVLAALGPDAKVQVPSLRARDSLTDMARDCLDLADGPLRIAGHSMGARVAMEMARLAPERVERLALLDTGIHPLKDGETEKRAEIVAFARDNGMQALAARWLPGMVHPDRHGDTALMSLLTEMVLRHDPKIHERQITALVNRPDAASYLGGITCPVQLIVGRQDAWSPVSQHEDMQRILPHANLVVIEDAGHFAPVEQPQAVIDALVPFLTSA